MNKAVTLKGRKEGFQLIIDAQAAMETVFEEIEELKRQLKNDTKADHVLKFFILTGNRVLTEDEQHKTKAILEDEFFKVVSFEADVITLSEARRRHEQSRPRMEVRTVRSGQIIEAEGDLLLIGEVHPGGMVRATGSIFIIGELKGIAHAGFSGKESAVVVANFRYNSQVRVGGNVHVVDEKEESQFNQSDTIEFVYVNDLHIIEVSPLHDLKRIRPEIAKDSGGIF
ncbi:septum site-determining protein MinC [Alkalibacterium psychrotolerans]